MEAVELAAARTRVAMVVPPQALVLAAVADMRAEHADDSELVDQVHYEEQVRVLASRDGWHYVQAEDHYFGWIRDDAIELLSSAPRGPVVAVPVAPIHREPEGGAEVVGYLPAGTPLALTQSPPSPEGWVRVKARSRRWAGEGSSGYVSLDDAVDRGDLPHRAPTARDLIATAEAFLGVPYLWGGTTGLGLDCSGYVQQVYRLNGLRLDRDADQQAVEGRRVDVAAPGDLIFFGGERVTHVALATGERTFLNAPQAGRRVERGTLGEGRTVLAIRRYLP